MLLLFSIGCGSPVGPTGGIVKFDDGEPVQAGKVEFRNRSDKLRYAGTINKSGRFTLKDKRGREGVPPGRYQVVVVQVVITEDLALEDHTHGRTVPRRFADYYTSGLEVQVKDGQTEDVEVLLPTPD